MHIEFWALEQDPENPTLVGKAWVDSEGRVVLDDTIDFVRELVIVEPGNPQRRLTPSDGSNYLEALPHNIKGTAFWAELIDQNAHLPP